MQDAIAMAADIKATLEDKDDELKSLNREIMLAQNNRRLIAAKIQLLRSTILKYKSGDDADLSFHFKLEELESARNRFMELHNKLIQTQQANYKLKRSIQAMQNECLKPEVHSHDNLLVEYKGHSISNQYTQQAIQILALFQKCNKLLELYKCYQ